MRGREETVGGEGGVVGGENHAQPSVHLSGIIERGGERPT